MKKILMTIVLIGIISTISAKDYYDETTDSKKIGWMDKGKELIKNRLKDADSAKFKNVYFIMSKLNIPTSCGEVNSKNSFGAYTGYKKYIFAGSQFVYLESDVSDFNNLWNSMCK